MSKKTLMNDWQKKYLWDGASWQGPSSY
jgi:hypothetical protein